MAIDAYQVSVGTSAVPLATVPPGPATVVLSVAGSGTAYIGAGGTTNLSTTTGFPVISAYGPVLIPGYASSGSTGLYAIASAAGTIVGVIISTDK